MALMATPGEKSENAEKPFRQTANPSAIGLKSEKTTIESVQQVGEGYCRGYCSYGIPWGTVGVENYPSQVCDAQKHQSTKSRFLEEIGVPFLVQGDQFVAFEDTRSIQMKVRHILFFLLFLGFTKL